MSTPSPHEKKQPSPPSCIDCGAPVKQLVGGIAICDHCLTTRGSCCPEFGAFDLTKNEAPREYASPPCSAHLFEEKDSIKHSISQKCFQTRSGAHLDYQIKDQREMDITHVFVPDSLRGQGLAANLVRTAISYAQNEDLEIHATCAYAAAYLKRK